MRAFVVVVAVVVGVVVVGTVEGLQKIVCEGESKCSGESIVCHDENCEIHCSGKNACNNAFIDASRSVNLQLLCDGVGTCADGRVDCGSGLCAITCDGDDAACLRTNVRCRDAFCHVNCTGDNSCHDGVISQCEGKNTVDLYCGGEDSCLDGTEHIVRVECEGSGSGSGSFDYGRDWKETCGAFDSNGKFLENALGELCGFVNTNSGTFVKDVSSFYRICGIIEPNGDFTPKAQVSEMKVCGFVDEHGFFVEVKWNNLANYKELNCRIMFDMTTNTMPDIKVKNLIPVSFQWAFQYAFKDDPNGYRIVKSELLSNDERKLLNTDETRTNGLEIEESRGLGRSEYNIRTHWGCNCDTDNPLIDTYRLRALKESGNNEKNHMQLENMAEILFWKEKRTGMEYFKPMIGLTFQCDGGALHGFSAD
mmetsp:Transcript_6496/g.9870  ORF Transcript_6496/g.9870 Transcript_6496/m.9870 type:complete len:422 (+) Transcript_6496:55-1320(+)